MPNSTHVTLKQLRYFARIVELGSISRASQNLHIAQTAIGLQVRSLEDCVGSTLLLRHPKGVSPTAEGEYLYEQAKGIIASVDSMVAEMRFKSGNKPRDIWFGLAPSIMQAIGMQAAVTQETELPSIRLHLFEASRNELLSDVLSGELDWAIVHETQDNERLFTVPIIRQAVVMVSRPGTGLAPGPVHLRDVLNRDLVLDSGKRVVSRVLSNAAKELGLELKVRYEIDSVSTTKMMILNEDVSGFFNRALVVDEVRRGELEIHEIVDPPLEITACFVARSADMPTTRDLPLLGFIDRLLDDYCSQNSDGEVRLKRLSSAVKESLVT